MAKKKTKTEILNGVDHYISTGECPNCGAKGVEGDGQLESTGNKAYQNCSCADCGYSFTDIYQLVGITPPKGDDIIPLEPSATRIWVCEDCGARTEWTYEDLAGQGGPICDTCDIDMEILPEKVQE